MRKKSGKFNHHVHKASKLGKEPNIKERWDMERNFGSCDMKIFLGSCVRLEVSFLLGVRKKLKGNFHKQAKTSILLHIIMLTQQNSLSMTK